MRFGIPYLGSKNLVAQKIIDFLPAGDALVDLFAGGCAITHCALENIRTRAPKWRKIISNDMNPQPAELFRKAVSGELRNEKRWISREDFFRLKDTDFYVCSAWSFSNKGSTYCYGRTIEPWKKALHYARALGDFSLIEEIVGEIPADVRKTNLHLFIKANQQRIARQYREWYLRKYAENCKEPLTKSDLQRLQSLESLERLQSLERLERLESIDFYARDFEAVPIPENAVIYCDIPYEDTTRSSFYGRLDYSRFYNWASKQGNVFISSYAISDPRFVCVAEFPCVCRCSSNGTRKNVERLFLRRKNEQIYREHANPAL